MKIQRFLPNFVKTGLRHVATWLPEDVYRSREYKQYRALLQQSAHWDKHHITEFQNLQFRMLIEHCYKHVPYYTETFANYGLTLNDVQDLRDLKKLPMIDKQIVKANRQKFIATNMKLHHLRETYTSGTTSASLKFYYSQTSNDREQAYFHRMWSKYGYQGQKCIILRGFLNEFPGLYTVDRLRNDINLNTVRIDDAKLAQFIQVIDQYEPEFMQAYPSLAYLFAKYINANGLSGQVGKIKAVFCASEKMFSFQRDEIVEAFQCPVVVHYGHNERCVLMEHCSECGVYHVIPEYGIAEILDSNDRQLTEANEIGEIVGTGFNNYAFPFIRYRTGDMATTVNETYSPACGRPYSSVAEIDGRSGDFLVTKDGKNYSPTMLEFANINVLNVKDMQLVQTSYDQLIVLLVPDMNYNEAEGYDFKQRLQKMITYDIDITVKLVDIIPRPLNQKRRFVISEVSLS